MCHTMSLLHLRDPRMDGCDLSALLKHCKGLKHLVAVTATEADALEKTQDSSTSLTYGTAHGLEG